ncbi:MAG: hypothetical protein AAGA85_04325 [Bacteroidota bacterium]
MITDFEDRRNIWLMPAVLVLVLIAVFLNLGLHPLSMEEPRRALIALEMKFNDNLWVPTQLGEPYYRKPPFYNWIIIAGYQMFGNTSEFATRFLSVVSYLATGLLCFWFGRKYVNVTVGLFSGLLFLTANDLLFVFTLVSGEIDLFYSLITYLGFLVIFHFGEKQNYYLLFLSVYLLGAIGTLTKGLPSPVFVAISLTTYFIAEGKWRQLVSLAHLVGILLYFGLVGGYFWMYQQHNDVSGYFFSEDSLIGQSTERTVLSKGIGALLIHFISFPISLLKVLAPASLFSIFLFRKDLLQMLRANRYIWFCTLIFCANVLVYWVSPGTASRYVYMLFPLATTVLFYAFCQASGTSFHRLLTGFFGVVITLFALASVTLPFIPTLEGINGLLVTSAGSFLCFAILLWLYWQHSQHRLLLFLVAVIGARLLFDLVVLPHRAKHGPVVEDKQLAYDILEKTGGQPVKIMGNSMISRTTIFYLERESEEVLSFDDDPQRGTFYLARLEDLANERYIRLLDFEFRDQAFALVRFEP